MIHGGKTKPANTHNASRDNIVAGRDDRPKRSYMFSGKIAVPFGHLTTGAASPFFLVGKNETQIAAMLEIWKEKNLVYIKGGETALLVTSLKQFGFY